MKEQNLEQMGWNYEKITEKSEDSAPVQVPSFWDRSRKAVKLAIWQFSEKIRQTYADLTAKTVKADSDVQYVTLVDEDRQQHKVTKADARRLILDMPVLLSLEPKCKVFEIWTTAGVVPWLVRLIHDDVPPIDQVSFEPAFAMELYREGRFLEIGGPEHWLQKMLAKQVASDPWQCLAWAWRDGGRIFHVIPMVIQYLPSYDILAFATSVLEQIKDLSPADRLSSYPFDGDFTIATTRGPFTVNFPPFFAFALAIDRAIKRMPKTNGKAAKGDTTALKDLLFRVFLAYEGAWSDTETPGKYSVRIVKDVT